MLTTNPSIPSVKLLIQGELVESKSIHRRDVFNPAMRLFELAVEAGVPVGMLNVTHGGMDVINLICEYPNI
ncbi:MULTISPECIES: hypothetical protein [Pseudomonas]|uniref:hypothetical protein n=1 Tax=Pseudomonas TaxID=286 RepID=UPI00071F46A6|nr:MULTISPECIES: hypothetical protein [Pseudomonas]ALQ02572.1 hypothetical protein AK973_2123 [Pseudomonas brassicacearum]